MRESDESTGGGGGRRVAGSERAHALALATALIALLAVGPLLRATGAVPATLTGHDESMTRYESLRAHVARDGPDDVMVIGPSVIRRGVVPRVVSSVIAERLGTLEPPRVFNFGVAGHNVRTYPFLVDLVTGVDRPRIVVLHVEPRAIDPDVSRAEDWAKIVLDSPYGAASEDRLRLRGALRRWLLDHWFLSAYAPTLRGRLLGEPAREPREPGGYDPERGYLARDPKEVTPENAAERQRFVESWRTDASFARALDRAVGRARDRGSRVLLVDAPINPALRRLMRDPEVNLGGLRAFLDDAGRRLDVPVAHAPRDLVPADEYADLTHLSPAGAERYSRWLGEAIVPHYPASDSPR